MLNLNDKITDHSKSSNPQLNGSNSAPSRSLEKKESPQSVYFADFFYGSKFRGFFSSFENALIYREFWFEAHHGSVKAYDSLSTFKGNVVFNINNDELAHQLCKLTSQL
jgi:hypothetical protein